MPKSQVANVANFDFGAPAVAGEVLKFSVKQGGKLTLRFENAEGSADFDVTVKISEDGTAFTNTAVATNGAAVVGETIPQRQYREFQIFEEVDAEKISADLKNGVLCVHLPKSESVKPHRIEVKGG